MFTKKISTPQSIAVLAGAALATLSGPAFASSDEAWAAFAQEVATACTELVTGPGEVSVEVNPFGSQSYGAAIVSVKIDTGNGQTGTDRMICIFDKATKAAELTGPFPLPGEDTAAVKQGG